MTTNSKIRVIRKIRGQRLYHDAYYALLNILDAAINDEAISPHYWAKRAIFDWWLIDVVPAAYYLRLPATICTDRGTSVPLSALEKQSQLLSPQGV